MQGQWASNTENAAEPQTEPQTVKQSDRTRGSKTTANEIVEEIDFGG